ncbi:MAG: phosphoribosylamine--glycine ligase [Pseudomonadota bacterium]
MRVLLLGSGGREHALAWAISKSPNLSKLYAAPGNAGIATYADCITLPIEEGHAIAAWSASNSIDLVVVGPEAPLAAGVADDLADIGIAVFGPSAAAAQLEASKAFTHEICDACGAPMADYKRFSNAAEARAYVSETGAPIVVKADGLAAGKGVVVAMTVEEAHAAIDAMIGGAFGAAGSEIVIEEFLEGEEASFFILSDGAAVCALAGAQDHKRAFDGDKGPNTGGMGAYSPAPVLTPDVEDRILDQIIRPVIREMARRGTPFKGVLFAGLMISDGQAKLIEFNVRFGDPESQVILLRLGSDLLSLLHACAVGDLASQEDILWKPDHAITVVLATDGYPGTYKTGSVIQGLEQAGKIPGVTVFHAGTSRTGRETRASGGRVLNVSASGPSLEEARRRAYEAVDLIDWPEGFCRRDIGWRAL